MFSPTFVQQEPRRRLRFQALLEGRMNILISGSTGLLGSELCRFFQKKEHNVIRLVRKERTVSNEICWDPASGKLDTADLEDIDAVVHLAGENIAAGRWSAEKKRRIRESRIRGTRLLSESIASLLDPPKVMVSVSAVGYYGNRGAQPLMEDSNPGIGFLPDLCREWEKATEAASRRGIRVVIPRIGMVLSAGGGALGLMLPIFRLGIGGRIGSGGQYMSWISIEDLVGAIDHAVHCEMLNGPLNAVSPNPVTNLAFSKMLASVLSRPALFALPAFAARILFGEMADEVLLASAKVLPAKLTGSGYQFRFPELEGALRDAIKKS